MLKATIEGTRYDVADKWEDISLKTFGELCAIEPPEGLNNLWENAKDEKIYGEMFDKLTPQETLKEFPIFFGKVIELLSAIPAVVIERIDSVLREEFYYAYFHQFYISNILGVPVVIKDGKIEAYDPEKLSGYSEDSKGFMFEGKEYLLPASETIFGNIIPAHKEQIITFAEAADINIALAEWKEHGIEAMSLVIGTYCRPPNEEYSEEATLERAKLFEGLDMKVVFQVFFYISDYNKHYEKNTQTYLKGMGLRETNQHSVPAV